MSNSVMNKPPFCNVYIHGDNNTVFFGSNCRLKANFFIGYEDSPVQGCSVLIGGNVTSTGVVEIGMCDDYSELVIGEDCMFSYGNTIYCSDTHAIIDYGTKQLLNLGKKVHIGNHVWIGMNAVILKNTIIPDNSIVGACALASGDYTNNAFSQGGIVIAGNPGKIIKTGISWDRRRPTQYKI